MNLKKIIREEMDELDWIRNLDVGIYLQPNTMYFFNPVANPSTIKKFSDKIIDAPEMKDRLQNREDPLSYFVTSDDVNELWGWCASTPPLKGKKEFYNDMVDMVDVRKEFGDIL